MTREPARSLIIGSYINPWDAYLACGRLKAEGLNAWVAYDRHVWADWPLSLALGGARIFAMSSESQAAKTVLAAHDRGEYESCLSEEDKDAARLRCPVCNSTDVETRRFGSLTPVLFLFFILGAIFAVRQDRHHCRICGCDWRY
ncbi:MAG TPA: hypothetical protein VN693_04130 [Rhodanobacteraceae bacterium]|nr:hypothetical protein [Rhodanobacteraceae bacterium]